MHQIRSEQSRYISLVWDTVENADSVDPSFQLSLFELSDVR